VDAEKYTEHAARLTDAALAVGREARRQGMQNGPVLPLRLLTGGDEDLAQVGNLDFLATEIDRGGIDVAGQTAGRNIDDQAIDGEAGHAFRRVHGKPHHAFSRIKICDHAGFYATRTLVADTDDLDMVGAPGQDLALLLRRQ